MLTVLSILAVLAVLFVAAAVATREGPILADAPADIADVELPDGPLQPEDVQAIRFGLAVRGYRMSEVDRVLDRVATELADRDRRLLELQHPKSDPASLPLTVSSVVLAKPEPVEPEVEPEPVEPEPVVPNEPPLDSPPLPPEEPGASGEPESTELEVGETADGEPEPVAPFEPPAEDPPAPATDDADEPDQPADEPDAPAEEPDAPVAEPTPPPVEVAVVPTEVAPIPASAAPTGDQDQSTRD